MHDLGDGVGISMPTESLLGRRFYEPKDVGLEREIRERLEKMREAREKK